MPDRNSTVDYRRQAKVVEDVFNSTLSNRSGRSTSSNSGGGSFDRGSINPPTIYTSPPVPLSRRQPSTSSLASTFNSSRPTISSASRSSTTSLATTNLKSSALSPDMSLGSTLSRFGNDIAFLGRTRSSLLPENLNSSLLSNIAEFVGEQVSRGNRVKGGVVEHPDSFTGQDIVVSVSTF